MNMLIASLVCIALLAISLAHFMWAFGRRWPIKDPSILARTVIGYAGVDTMPPWYRSLAIAVLTLIASVFVLALADHDSGGPNMSLFGVLVGLIFLVRGIIGYLPFWRRLTPEEPFRTNDFRVYSPLCLLIGIGFLALVLMRYA